MQQSATSFNKMRRSWMVIIHASRLVGFGFVSPEGEGCKGYESWHGLTDKKSQDYAVP